jgi:hypothetical protein
MGSSILFLFILTWPNGIPKNESTPLGEENPWYVISFSWLMAIGFFKPVIE